MERQCSSDLEGCRLHGAAWTLGPCSPQGGCWAPAVLQDSSTLSHTQLDLNPSFLPVRKSLNCFEPQFPTLLEEGKRIAIISVRAHLQPSRHSPFRHTSGASSRGSVWLCSGKPVTEGSVCTPENSSLPTMSVSWWINTAGPHPWVGQLQSAQRPGVEPLTCRACSLNCLPSLLLGPPGAPPKLTARHRNLPFKHTVRM